MLDVEREQGEGEIREASCRISGRENANGVFVNAPWVHRGNVNIDKQERNRSRKRVPNFVPQHPLPARAPFRGGSQCKLELYFAVVFKSLFYASEQYSFRPVSEVKKVKRGKEKKKKQKKRTRQVLTI